MLHKKVSALLAAGISVAMLASLAACGRTENASSSTANSAVTTLDNKPATGELNIWAMGNEGDLLGEFAKGFNKENPDVKVKVTAIPWASAHDKIQTAIAAGNGPDVMQMGTTWMADFANAFTEVPKNFDLSDFNEGPLKTAQVDGAQLGVPWYVDSHVLYYRTDIAKKAGWDHAPQTLDELYQMAQEVKKVDGVTNGLFIAASGADTWQGTLWAYFSMGAKLTDGKKWTLNTPEMKKATEYIDNYFKNNITDTALDATPGLPITQFVNGETPIMTGGPTTISQIESQGGDPSNYATALIPKGESSTSFIGGANLVVTKDAKNADAAWKFIRWITQAKTQVDWYKKATVLPSSKKAWTDDVLSKDEKLKVYGEQLETGTMAPPAVTTWTQVSAEGDRIMEQIHKGQISVDEGLKNLQDAADAVGMGK